MTQQNNNILIDAAGKPLGRLAAEIAFKLRGKHKADFKPNVVPSQKIIVINTDYINIFPSKLKNKFYWRYSGYPGGMKLTPLGKIFAKDSTKVLRKTVFGMLPKNRLRSKIIKNLIMFKKDNPIKM